MSDYSDVLYEKHHHVATITRATTSRRAVMPFASNASRNGRAR